VSRGTIDDPKLEEDADRIAASGVRSLRIPAPEGRGVNIVLSASTRGARLTVDYRAARHLWPPTTLIHKAFVDGDASPLRPQGR